MYSTHAREQHEPNMEESTGFVMQMRTVAISNVERVVQDFFVVAGSSRNGALLHSQEGLGSTDEIPDILETGALS